MTTKSNLTPKQILNYEKNDEILHKTKDVQSKTLQSLDRTKRDISNANKLADESLATLQDQREQIIGTIRENEKLHTLLDRSEELVHQLHGFRIPNFLQLTESQKRQYADVVAVYEHQEYSFISKTWSASDYVSSQNQKLSVKDAFDPKFATADGILFWTVDINYSHIDNEGFVYGSSFAEIDKGKGKESTKGILFSMVRRRVWKRNNDPSTQRQQEILMRNLQRKQQQRENPNDPSVHTDDISLLLEGTSHGHNDMTKQQEKELKQIHKTDQKIDREIDEIAKGVDKLHVKAEQAGHELKFQQAVIKQLDEKVDENLAHVTQVNKELKPKVDNQCTCVVS